MGTTPKYGWHYPEGGDKPQGNTQMKTLATDIETTVAAQLARLDAVFAKRTGGVYETTTTDTIAIPQGSFVAQPVGKAIRDPAKWHNATAKTVRVPAGLYTIGGRLIVHLPENRQHQISVAWWITKPNGAGVEHLAQWDVSYNGSADVAVLISNGLLYAPETLDIRPGGYAHTAAGDSMWYGSSIRVACLVDAAGMGTLLKDVEPTYPMPPILIPRQPGDYGYADIREIKP